MRRFDGILFDLGHTLIYFDADWPQVLEQADSALLQPLKAAGLVLPEEAFLKEFRDRALHYHDERNTEFVEYTTAYLLSTLLAKYGYPQVPEALLRSALKAMYAVSQAHWQPEDDAIPILAALKERGYRLGMISNASDEDDVQTLVDKARLRPFLDFILTSAAVGVRKPNPRIFELALEKWGFPPERVAMVGDTLGADILGARNAGLFGIWITRRADVPANRAHAGTIQPDASIASLSELPGLLEAP